MVRLRPFRRHLKLFNFIGGSDIGFTISLESSKNTLEGSGFPSPAVRGFRFLKRRNTQGSRFLHGDVGGFRFLRHRLSEGSSCLYAPSPTVDGFKFIKRRNPQGSRSLRGGCGGFRFLRHRSRTGHSPGPPVTEGSGFWCEETHRVRDFCAGTLEGSGFCVNVRQRVRISGIFRPQPWKGSSF